MKRKLSSLCLAAATLISGLSLVVVPVSAATSSQTNLQLLISRGNTEITRRLNTLNAALNRLNSAKKLSSSDKATLTNEVNDEISGLTALKTKLDAETTVEAAKADDQSIVNDYRVYVLVVPKINLVVTADAQQTTEDKLTALAAKLQARLDTAKAAGKDVTALQTTLGDMSAKTQAAQGLSSSIETAVISLQPTDYNNDHKLLGGDRDTLTTAQADIKTAIGDAQTIVTALKKM